MGHRPIMAEVRKRTAEVLARWRKEAGLSQKELAARLLITQAHISSVERGVAAASPDLLVQWADALGRTLLDFCQETGLVPPEAITWEQRVAAQLQRTPELAAWWAVMEQIVALDPRKMGELVRHAKWLYVEMGGAREETLVQGVLDLLAQGPAFAEWFDIAREVALRDTAYMPQFVRQVQELYCEWLRETKQEEERDVLKGSRHKK